MSLIVLICYDVSNFHVTKVIYNSPFRKYSPLFFALLRIMNRLQRLIQHNDTIRAYMSFLQRILNKIQIGSKTIQYNC